MTSSGRSRRRDADVRSSARGRIARRVPPIVPTTQPETAETIRLILSSPQRLGDLVGVGEPIFSIPADEFETFAGNGLAAWGTWAGVPLVAGPIGQYVETPGAPPIGMRPVYVVPDWEVVDDDWVPLTYPDSFECVIVMCDGVPTSWCPLFDPAARDALDERKRCEDAAMRNFLIAVGASWITGSMAVVGCSTPPTCFAVVAALAIHYAIQSRALLINLENCERAFDRSWTKALQEACSQ